MNLNETRNILKRLKEKLEIMNENNQTRYSIPFDVHENELNALDVVINMLKEPNNPNL